MFTCSTCRDENGWVEILPATRDAHPTVARCPHNAAQLLEVKRRVEFERATKHKPTARRRPPGEPPHAFSEPIHQHEEPMFR